MAWGPCGSGAGAAPRTWEQGTGLRQQQVGRPYAFPTEQLAVAQALGHSVTSPPMGARRGRMPTEPPTDKWPTLLFPMGTIFPKMLPVETESATVNTDEKAEQTKMLQALLSWGLDPTGKGWLPWLSPACPGGADKLYPQGELHVPDPSAGLPWAHG